MGGWKTILAAFLRGLAALLEHVRARRQDALRRREVALRVRLADDPCGVLLDQLNPGRDGGASCPAGADQPATAGAQRHAGVVDGQPGRGHAGAVDSDSDGRG